MRSSSCNSNPADLGPHRKRTPPCSSILAGRDMVAAKRKEVVDLVVGGEETLCLAGRFEALHLPLSSAASAGANFPLCCSVPYAADARRRAGSPALPRHSWQACR